MSDSFDEAAYEATEAEDRRLQTVWDEYWESLTPDEKAEEIAMMDAHVAQQEHQS